MKKTKIGKFAPHIIEDLIISIQNESQWGRKIQLSERLFLAVDKKTPLEIIPTGLGAISKRR